jgi:hypothetical protein
LDENNEVVGWEIDWDEERLEYLAQEKFENFWNEDSGLLIKSNFFDIPADKLGGHEYAIGSFGSGGDE